MLPERPSHPLVVMNGDLLTRINISRLLKFHQTGDYVGTMAVREHEVVVPFGVAQLEENQVVALEEKPSLNYQINAGIYVVNPELLDRIPPDTFYPITQLWSACLEEGLRLGGYAMQESWNDIGRPEQYEAAEVEPL